MDLITTHLNADFDALASMVAAGKFYPDAVMVFSGSQEKTVREFLSSSLNTFNFKRLRDINLAEVTRLILVDVKNPERIGKFSEILGANGLVIHIFDHHPFSPDDIRGDSEVIETVGATTTIFSEMLNKENVKISPAEATVLMLGIYEETGSLTFPSTTVRDITAAAWLLKKGANLNIVSRFLKRELTPEEIDLLNELVHSAKDYVIHNSRIKIAAASRDAYIGEIASLAHRMHDMDDSDAVFLLVMMEDRLQMIARSHVPEVDVSGILAHFGGGGHPYASSAVIRDMTIEDAENMLTAILKKEIKPSKTAKDIMTSPVKTIPWNSTIKNAENSMTRYEVNVLPVIKSSSYYGIISREIVEKAMFHGFGNSKVEEFCTTDAPTVSPSTSLSMIESQMVEQNQRFTTVLENKKVLGAITRTDLLRSLYESLLRKERVPSYDKITGKPSIGKNLSSLMKSTYPKEIYSLLEISGIAADSLGYNAYLVGGSVRDLICGNANLDIDIVIEGNGIRFANVLGKKLKTKKIRTHKRFGTAVIVTDFLKFDVATARTEYYESPAALPTVETSSIKKDLYRRDFTINSMAIKLNPKGFGHLIDFFGAQRDLKDKTIRILHNLSFIEDPTRAFRAIRFSERFGFKISKHTLNLIKTAVRINLFDKLSGTRIYDELTLMFLEAEPIKAIKKLSELGLLRFIHPAIAVNKKLEEGFESVQETVAWFNLQFFEEKIDKATLFLMVLLEGLTADEKKEAFKRLQVPQKTSGEILNAFEKSGDALSKLGKKPSNRDLYYTLLPLDNQTILFAMTKAKDKEQKKAISHYLTSLRHIKPELTGKDLKSIGYKAGPLFRDIFRAILDKRLEGKIRSREEEVSFLKKNFTLLSPKKANSQ